MATERWDTRRRPGRPGPVAEALRRGTIARELADDVDGLLTEDQLRRLRLQAELSLDIRKKEYELDMQILRDHARQRDIEYEFELRYTLDSDELNDRRWHDAFDRVERRNLHLPRVVREWTSVGSRVLGLVAGAAALYACGRVGITPADAWHALFS